MVLMSPFNGFFFFFFFFVFVFVFVLFCFFFFCAISWSLPTRTFLKCCVYSMRKKKALHFLLEASVELLRIMDK